MLTVTVNNATVTVLEGSVQLKSTLDGRSTLTCIVRDDTGLQHYQPGQTVTVTDSTYGIIYAGYINDSQEQNLYPQATTLSTLSCIDGHYLADKRYYSGPEYTGRYAGDIASDLLANYLSAEGILSAYAVDNAQTVAQFNRAVLSNVIGTSNVSGGDLELAPSGTGVNYVESGTAFSTGTVNSTLCTPSGLAQTPYYVIKATATQSIANANNTYSYIKFASPNYTVPSANTGFILYDLFIVGSSPEAKIALDFVCTDGTTWRDNATHNDGYGQPPHPNTDLSSLAVNTWYHRNISIAEFANKTISYFTIGFEGDKAGDYIAYLRNIQIVDNSFNVMYTPLSSTVSGSVSGGYWRPSVLGFPILLTQQMQTYGYSVSKLQVVYAYNSYDYRWTPAISIDAAKLTAQTAINWTTTTPNNAQIQIGYSLDGGASYIPCTNGSPLPYWPAGLSTAGRSIQFIQFLMVGDTPEDTPVLTKFQYALQPSYSSTKQDVLYRTVLSSDWTAGTFSNTSNNGGFTLSLNGYTRNWDSSSNPSQTLFSASGGEFGDSNKTLYVGCDNANDARLRFDFVPSMTNFTMEFDCYVQTNVPTGCVYRTTNWNAANNTFAYMCTVEPTALKLGYGSNSGSSGTFTGLSTVAVSLVSGNWHRLTIVVNGTSHKIYLDNVKLIDLTDSTFTGSGQVGMRIVNSSGAHTRGYMDNFGIAATTSGTWISPAISLAAASVYSTSNMYWADVSQSSTNCTITTDVSYDGGTTWANVTLGQPLPGLTIGQSLTSVSLKFRFTLATTSVTTLPAVNAVSLKILGAFTSSGSRQSYGLLLSDVGRAGNTLVSWTGNAPANTTIGIDTSLDGTNWTQIGTGASGGAQIAGIASLSDPYLDSFTTNTSNLYTSLARSGGTVANWTYDTSNGRLIALAGANGGTALYIYSGLSAADAAVTFDTDTADGAGAVLSYQNNNTFYYVAIYDSAGIYPNLFSANKYTPGGVTNLGTGSITFQRGTAHRFVFQNLNNKITLKMDGVTLLTYDDSSTSPIGAGQTGLLIDNNTAHFNLFRAQTFGADVSAMEVFSRVRMTSTDPTVTPQLYDLSVSVHSQDIQSGALIPATSYSVLNGNNSTLAQIIDDLCKQSNYWSRFAPDPASGVQKFYFQSKQAQLAPWIVQNSDVQVSNLQIDNMNDAYRNGEWVYGGNDVTLLTETFIGNGVQTTFTTGYPVDSVVSMSVNSVASTYGVNGSDTGKNFYYTQGANEIVQDTSNIPLNNTQTLAISYYGKVAITVHVQDDTAIAARAASDGTTGIVEFAVDGSGLNKQSMITLADGDLTQYAITGKTIQFDSLRGGLSVGQLLTVYLTPYGIVDSPFLITDIETNWRTVNLNGATTLQAVYTVNGVNGPVVGDWTHFINGLAR